MSEERNRINGQLFTFSQKPTLENNPQRYIQVFITSLSEKFSYVGTQIVNL